MMTSRPTVSILVPIYGVARHIRKCAESLFKQTYDNIEFVFVDDCTPDNSIEELQKAMDAYPYRKSHTRIIHHKRNRGLAAARNTGIYSAIGEYLMHVDGDDYLTTDDAVEKVVAIIQSENADIVTFGFRHVYKDSYKDLIQDIPTDKIEYVHSTLTRKVSVCVWGGIYKTSLYRDNHIIHYEGLNMGEDYAVKPRLLYAADKVVYLPEPLYSYVQYNENAYTKNFKSKHVTDLQNVFRILTVWAYYTPEKDSFLRDLQIAKAAVKASFLSAWGVSNATHKEFTQVRKMESDWYWKYPEVKRHDKLLILIASLRLPWLFRQIQHIHLKNKQ